MHFFYIDESGSPHRHSEPLGNGETPLFCVTALALHSDLWRRFTREYIHLKRQSFPGEIGEREAAVYEVKGNSLTTPRNAASRRRQVFASQVFDRLTSYDAKLFSVIFLKNAVQPTPKASMYGMAIQYLAERFQAFLEELPQQETGLMILDSRVRSEDILLAKSHLTYTFGHESGRTLDRIVEAPLFADSKLTTGLQLADIAGAFVYAYHYRQHLRSISNAVDYSHIDPWWPRVQQLEFRSRSPHMGRMLWGFRVLDHRKTPA